MQILYILSSGLQIPNSSTLQIPNSSTLQIPNSSIVGKKQQNTNDKKNK